MTTRNDDSETYNDSDDKLNELLDYEDDGDGSSSSGRGSGVTEPYYEEDESRINLGKNVQWATDGTLFFPSGKTVKGLIPGYYSVGKDYHKGIFLNKIKIKSEDIIHFPDSTSDIVVAEIEKFWNMRESFEQHNLPYKRGILLWGPPGGGKTCVCRQLLEAIVERKGVCIKFEKPSFVEEGLRLVRDIQPNVPILVLMEDLDSLFERHDDSEILNLLDGVEDVSNIVFLATTNYPGKLKARVVNRPSRFDKRFEISFPTEEARRMYFEHLFSKKGKINKKELNKWVADTAKLTLAHLKELYIAVKMFGDEYDVALKSIRSMKERIKENNDEKKIGFSAEE